MLAKPLHTQSAACPTTHIMSPLRSHISRCTSAGGPQQDLAPRASSTCYSPCHQAPGLPQPTQSLGSTSQHSKPLRAQQCVHGLDAVLPHVRLSLPILPVSAKSSPFTPEPKLQSQGAAEGQAHPVLFPTQAGTCDGLHLLAHSSSRWETPGNVAHPLRTEETLTRIHEVALAYPFTSCDTTDLYHRPPPHTSFWLTTSI